MPDTTTAIYGFVKPELGGSPGTWDDKLVADLDSLDQELARLRVPFLTPAVGATTTCDLSQTTGARVFAFTVSQATTLALTNVPSSSFAVTVRLIITNGAAFTLTWPASVSWLSGYAPTLAANGVDVVELITRDGGTTWYARPLWGRLRHADTTDAGTGANTAETTLKTHVLPTLGAGDLVEIWVNYSISGTANTKVARLKTGATVLWSNSAAAGTNGESSLYASLVKDNSSGARTIGQAVGIVAGTADLETVNVGAELSGATITFTGETANAADEINMVTFVVRITRA